MSIRIVREYNNIALSRWFVPAIIAAFCYEFWEKEQNKEKDAGKNGPTSRGKHTSARLQNFVMWWWPCFAGLILLARYIKELENLKVMEESEGMRMYFSLLCLRYSSFKTRRSSERKLAKRLHKASLVFKFLFEKKREWLKRGGMEKIIHWNVWADLKWSGLSRQPIRLCCLVLG